MNKFTDGLERGSSQKTSKGKRISDLNAKSQPKSGKESAEPSSGGKGSLKNQPPNTTRQSLVKTSQDLDHADGGEMKKRFGDAKLGSNNVKVSNFQSNHASGTRTA